MNKKRKILFIVNSFPVVSETFIVNHAKACADAGYDVTISANEINSLKDSSQKQILLDYGFLKNIHNRKLSIPKNKFQRYIKLFFCFLYNYKDFYVLKKILLKPGVDRIKKCLRYIDFKPFFENDVIHVHFGDNGVFLFEDYIFDFIKKTSKVIVTFHGYDAHYTTYNFKLIKNKYNKLFERSTFVIANSSYIKNKLIKLGSLESKTIIIPIGVDIDLFSSKNELFSDRLNMISVGRLEPLKGHIFGIRVVEKLLSLGFDVGYKIIGDGSLFNSLKKIINEKGMSSSVELLGAQSQKNIVEVLQESHVFLMTSTKDSKGRSEAFGLVTVEAQSIGLPVIAFDTGGVSDIVKNTISGFLVTDKSVDDMTKRVIELINDNDLYVTMSRNARLNVLKKFKQEIILNKHLELYES